MSPTLSPTQESFPLHTQKDSAYWRIPAPLAYSTIEMLREPLINSADELILLLEAWLRHLGWLWIAEYLHGSEQDHALDRMLFRTFLEGQRELTVGNWAYIGSRISHLYRRNQWQVQIHPLLSFTYGDPRDKRSPLSQLLRYRNSFAHGSFDAQEQDILTHRSLLWSLLAPIQPLLEECPIVFWDPKHNGVRAADGSWSPRPEFLLPKQEAYLPYMMCSPTLNAPLAPFLHIRCIEAGESEHHIYAHLPDVPPWYLQYTSLHQLPDTARRLLFQGNPKVAQHREEYQQQRLGSIDLQPEWDKIRPPTMPKEDFQTLHQQLKTALDNTRDNQPNFVLLSGYPGSGKSIFVAQATQYFTGFDRVITYRLEPQSPTLSATTFLRYMLRELGSHGSRITGHGSGIMRHELREGSVQRSGDEKSPSEGISLKQLSLDELREEFYQQLHQLRHQKCRLLLAIDQFHLAYHPYREETLSICDVLSHIDGVSSQYMGVLLAARLGYRDNLLHDTQITIPPQDYPLQEKYDLMLEELGLHFVDFPDPDTIDLSEEERIFRRMLLFVLSTAPKPLTAFEARNALEDLLKQKPSLFPTNFLFSPRIARTLWDLRPVLLWESSQDTHNTDKTFTPFCKSFGTWLAENLAPHVCKFES